MHGFGRTNNRVYWASGNAQGAADTAGRVDDRNMAGFGHAAFSSDGFDRQSGDVRQ
jgi:hypothetical protein